MNLYSYFNGISIAFYFIVCLLCGLQLVGHIFSYNRYVNSIVSRLLGSVFLTWACGALLYMVCTITQIDCLAQIGSIIDVAAFAGLACLAYVLYANQWPKFRTTLILSLPYVLIIIFDIIFPHLFNVAFIVVMACLLGQYLYYFRALHRREQMLDHLYADPERHSLKWLNTFAAMYAVYWAVRICFSYTVLSPWSDVALYACMTVLILFVFAKVCNYGESVSLETQQKLENVPNLQPATCHLQPATGHLQPARISELMEQEQLYLNPDLTLEDVASKLNTSPWALSAVLNKDIGISFSQYVNTYRVEKAKELLSTTDDKSEHIGLCSGFNSRQSFYRTFTKFTGQTPAEWRKTRGFTNL